MLKITKKYEEMSYIGSIDFETVKETANEVLT